MFLNFDNRLINQMSLAQSATMKTLLFIQKPIVFCLFPSCKTLEISN